MNESASQFMQEQGPGGEDFVTEIEDIIKSEDQNRLAQLAARGIKLQKMGPMEIHEWEEELGREPKDGDRVTIDGGTYFIYSGATHFIFKPSTDEN